MIRLSLTGLLSLMLLASPTLHAQAPAPPASARQLGTVRTIDGTTLTLLTASGALVSVSVAPDAPVLQLPPGSTDLKSAQPATLADVAIGDRISTGKAGDTLTASRVILMKSNAIAARNADEQMDWKKRGTGGLVKSVNGPVFTIAGANGTRTIQVATSPTTRLRRYADDSIKFEDAKPGTLAQILPGDQLRVRGTQVETRTGPNTLTTITAEEVVSGTFSNLSGPVSAVDSAAGTITLTDSNTKQPAIVRVTPKSDLRKLSPRAAATLTAPNSTSKATAQDPSQALAAMLPQLPNVSLADLHPGDSVLIVATQDHAASAATDLTAVTLLSGVGPLLSSNGSRPVTLSPWNLGSPDAGPSQ